MSAYEFTLNKESGGRSIYAHIRVDIATGANGYEFVWAASSNVPTALAAAAEKGAQFAWQHQTAVDLREGIRIRIDEIGFSATNTSPHAAAFASCHAVWGALGTDGDTELRIGDIDLGAPDV